MKRYIAHATAALLVTAGLHAQTAAPKVMYH